jgi:hypothetical protein
MKYCVFLFRLAAISQTVLVIKEATLRWKEQGYYQGHHEIVDVCCQWLRVLNVRIEFSNFKMP